MPDRRYAALIRHILLQGISKAGTEMGRPLPLRVRAGGRPIRRGISGLIGKTRHRRLLQTEKIVLQSLSAPLVALTF